MVRRNPNWNNISNWKKEYPKGCQLETALNIYSIQFPGAYMRNFLMNVDNNFDTYLTGAQHHNIHGKYELYNSQKGLSGLSLAITITKNNLKRLHEWIGKLIDNNDKIEVEHWAIRFFYRIAGLMKLSVHRINPKEVKLNSCVVFTRNKDVIFLLCAWKNGNMNRFPKDMIRYIAEILK